MDSTKPIAFTINPVRVVDAVDADSYFDPTQHPNAVQRADECREIVDSGARALIYFSGPLDPEDERAVRTVLVQIRCAVLADRAERKLRSDAHQEAMRAYLEDEDDLAALVIRSSAPDENMRDMVARAIREERERGDARVLAERERCAEVADGFPNTAHTGSDIATAIRALEPTVVGVTRAGELVSALRAAYRDHIPSSK